MDKQMFLDIQENRITDVEPAYASIVELGHLATDETYDDLIDLALDGDEAAKARAESHITTNYADNDDKDEQGNSKIKNLTMAEWKALGSPKHHGDWMPKHVWFGVDPGLSKQKAKKLAREI